MKSRETILQELKEISPLLAGLDPINPYSVPYNYFEELEGKVKKAIKAQNDLTGVIHAHEEFMGAVSASDELPGILKDELPGILADLKASKPMTVPAGYFDSFASSVLQKIKEEESVNPEGSKIQDPEPVLASNPLKKVTGSEEESTPVIKMVPRRKVFLQWAVAAVTIGIIALAVFLYNGNEQTGSNIASTQPEIDGFSIETLESFVEGQRVTIIPTVASTSSELKAEDMRAVMDDISEEALQLYLNNQTVNLETQVN